MPSAKKGVEGLKRQGHTKMFNEQADKIMKQLEKSSAYDNAVKSVQDGEKFNKKHFKK